MHDNGQLATAQKPPSAPLPPKPKRTWGRWAVGAVAVLISALAVFALIWTHGARAGYTRISNDNPFTVTYENHGDTRALGDEVRVEFEQYLGNYGRTLAIRPTWPRATDDGECFGPRKSQLYLQMTGPHFQIFFRAVRDVRGGPWELTANNGKGGPQLDVTQVVEAPRPKSSAPGGADCPEWRIKLPLKMYASGPVSTGGGSYAEPLDWPAWKAWAKRAAAGRG